MELSFRRITIFQAQGFEIDCRSKDNANLEKLEKLGIKNPVTSVKSEELEDILEPFRLNANKALKLYSSGVEIGHTCHVFRGYL